LISLKNHGSFWNDLGYFSNQPGEFLINPALSLSLLFLYSLMIVLIRRNYTNKSLAVTALLLFLLWGSKFYAGIVGCFYVAIYLTVDLLKHKITFRRYLLYGISLMATSIFVVLVFYNPFALGSHKSVFVLDPFKTIHAMIEDPELIPIRKVALARYYLYTVDTLIRPKLWLIEIFTLGLYLVFSLGTRIFGLLYVVDKNKKVNILITIYSTSIFGILLGTMFIQNGIDWFNTIQFLAYSQFLLQIPVAMVAYNFILTKSLPKTIFGVLLLIVTFTGALIPIGKYGQQISILNKLIDFERPQKKYIYQKASLKHLNF
jgi:hypothetical protein